jgi:hypothetical protein
MDRLEQLREMIAAKAKELEADRPRIEKIKARTDSAKFGDMFMLPININDEFCIFWTVVRLVSTISSSQKMIVLSSSQCA